MIRKCYYCGLPGLSLAHDVPVCREHQPKEPETERTLVAAEPIIEVPEEWDDNRYWAARYA